MDYMEIINKYFRAWLENDIVIIDHVFADEIVYSECYGPEYHGIDQIRKWFAEWNTRGQVLEWPIKRMLQQGNIVVVEWYFKCCYDNDIDAFDGVTIAEFDHDGKIVKLSEFQSKAEHYFPFGE